MPVTHLLELIQGEVHPSKSMGAYLPTFQLPAVSNDLVDSAELRNTI
jgi:hypothetical protein